jgi:hypothetical protein
MAFRCAATRGPLISLVLMVYYDPVRTGARLTPILKAASAK